MGRARLGRTAALLFSLALVSGCGSSAVDFAGSGSAVTSPTHSAIQRDKKPVLERFPKLGKVR